MNLETICIDSFYVYGKLQNERILHYCKTLDTHLYFSAFDMRLLILNIEKFLGIIFSL